MAAGTSSEGSSPPRVHSVHGIAMSAAFLKNWSISKVLEAATWMSNPVFAAFYFRDLSFSWMAAIPSALLSLQVRSWRHNFGLCP